MVPIELLPRLRLQGGRATEKEEQAGGQKFTKGGWGYGSSIHDAWHGLKREKI